MDNLTHTLLAVTLSRAGLNRFSPHATLLLVAGANAPDLDVVAGLGRTGAALDLHRGPTHSALLWPLMALAVTAAVWLFRRRTIRWLRAYPVALIGVASNPLFDLANSYGVRLWWPFSDQWLHADLVAIFDIWVWALLALGLVAPWFGGLVSREMGARAGSGRGAAVFVLVLLAGYLGGRYLLHQRAVAVLDSRMYLGEVPARVAAMPSPVDPFAWTGLVEGAGFVQLHPRLHLLREFDPEEGRTFYKPTGNAAVERARQAGPFRGFLGFAQWPVWRVSPAPEGEGAVVVELCDVRFGPPERSRFSVSARIDSQGRVLEAGPRR